MDQTPIRISGEIIEQNVSYRDFLMRYAGQHVEWVYGDVIQMAPVSKEQNIFNRFLIGLFDNYLAMTRGGEVLYDPMVMKLTPHLPGRQPDIQVLLPENLHRLQENEVAGPADLVMEITSPESHRRDRHEKFGEYEAGGVKEYWILDPMRKESLFYHLNNEGIYEPVEPDKEGIYHSKVLERFRIRTSIFWDDPLPRGPAIVKLVEAMLKGET